ncbi:MAG: hypothetical protein AMXMBFR13_24080 [Phycisphaerae bacterium]|jgi:hypothetical protein
MRQEFEVDANVPGAWLDFPAAIRQGDDIVAWARKEKEAHCLVEVLNSAQTIPATSQLLMDDAGQLRHPAPEPFGVEMVSDGDLLGYAYALKSDGEVIAWLKEPSLASVLSDMLNHAAMCVA